MPRWDPPPCGCPQPPAEPPVKLPMDCDDEPICSCHIGCPPPLSVIDVDGIKYWTWEGRLLVDCDGNFIPVSGQTIPWDRIQAYIDARIPGNYDARLAEIERRLTALEALVNNKADRFTLKTLTIDGIERSLFGEGTITFCTPGCDEPDPGPGPDPGTENTVYLAFAQDNGSIPNIPANAVTVTVNNVLSGTYDVTNPTDGYSLYIWAPSGVTVPSTDLCVAVNGNATSTSDFADIADLHFIGTNNGYNVYVEYAHNDNRQLHLLSRTYTIKF